LFAAKATPTVNQGNNKGLDYPEPIERLYPLTKSPQTAKIRPLPKPFVVSLTKPFLVGLQKPYLVSLSNHNGQ
jgi:hypothetical protein